MEYSLLLSSRSDIFYVGSLYNFGIFCYDIWREKLTMYYQRICTDGGQF